jgi:HAMP domain-containing protein
MLDIIHLVVAYAVFWGLTFVLVASMWARQRRLERGISRIETLLQKIEQIEQGQ